MNSKAVARGRRGSGLRVPIAWEVPAPWWLSQGTDGSCGHQEDGVLRGQLCPQSLISCFSLSPGIIPLAETHHGSEGRAGPEVMEPGMLQVGRGTQSAPMTLMRQAQHIPCGYMGPFDGLTGPRPTLLLTVSSLLLTLVSCTFCWLLMK